MKLRTYRLRYYAQQTTIAMLFIVGLIAMSGEPTESSHYLLATFAQAFVLLAAWISAYCLYFHWQIGKREKRIDFIKRARQ